MPKRPERVLLDAVAELHDQGFELLRIAPYVYATGHWRVELVPATATDPSNGSLVRDHGVESYGYSAAMGADMFDDGVHYTDPQRVATALLRTLPGLMNASKGQDRAYVAWYEAMLSLIWPSALPYAFSEYEEPSQHLYVEGASTTGAKTIPAAPTASS